MTRANYNIVGSYDVERDKTIDSQRTINMYVLPSVVNKEKAILAPADGFEQPFTVGDGPIRAQFVFKDVMYVVSSDKIYSVTSGLVVTFLGTMTTSSGYVGIDANETQVMFVDGVNGFIWDTVSSVFSTVVFGFPVLPPDVTAMDGYFVIIDNNKNDFYISALGDGTTWNVLDIAKFLSKPDQLVALTNLKRRIYLFGKISTEIWLDVGASDFPFRRDNNVLFEHGCAAPKTVQEGFEKLFYLATNRDGAAGIMMVNGISNPQKISTPAIDLFLQNLTLISDAEAILYRENGIIFYQISFTKDDKTFVYVVNTNSWHELMTHDEKRHPATAHVYFANKHFIGMYNTNQVYEMSYKFITYATELIRCIRIGSPFFTQTHQRIRVDRFELETIPGIPDCTFDNQSTYTGLNDLVITNTSPKVILFISRDGGRTFGNGRRAITGRLGQYMARTIWRRLGTLKGRRIVFKIEYAYKTRFYIIGADIVYEALPQ